MHETRPLAAAAAALTAALALAAAGQSTGERPIDPSGLALAGALSSLAFVALALVGAFLRPRPVRDSLALIGPRSEGARPMTVLLGQLGWGLLVSAALSTSGLTEGSTLEEIDRTVEQAAAPGIALLTIGVALMPGIGEELLFRGLLLGALLPRVGASAAILVSTLPFAVLHIDPAHAIGAALLGVYLGSARVATGSTLVCIACHVANNAMAILLATRDWPGIVDWILLPAAALAAAAGWRTMIRQVRRAGVAGVESAG